MPLHLENYYVIRKINSNSAFLIVGDPATEREGTYQNLLDEANRNYLHREYTLALSNYARLRRLIFLDCHPEIPFSPGSEYVIDLDFTRAEIDRFFEMGRRLLAAALPGDRVLQPARDSALIQPGDFPVSTAAEPFRNIGVNPPIKPVREFHSRRREARECLLDGKTDDAERVYGDAVQAAIAAGQTRAAAEILTERAAMLATYTTGETRVRVLKAAAAFFRQAEGLYRRMGDEDALAVLADNLEKIAAEQQPRPQPGADRSGAQNNHNRLEAWLKIRANGKRSLDQLVRLDKMPEAGTASIFLVPEEDNFISAASLLIDSAALRASERSFGLLTNRGMKSIPIDREQYAKALKSELYQPRVMASNLDALDFFESIETNFVAYIPHLFFFVLPIALGDTYLALGQYEKALEGYQAVLNYPFLNKGIEAPYLWLKMAGVFLQWGEELFRRGQPSEAQTKYEAIILAGLVINPSSPLYSPEPFAPLKVEIRKVVELMSGKAREDINPKIAGLVINAHIQLQKIKAGLNFLGLSDGHVPVFRFKYLQGIANYLVDSAIQTERTFINFRNAAENAKLERMQLENSVNVNQALLEMEEKREIDAALEVSYAKSAVDYAKIRASNMEQTLEEYRENGWDIAMMNWQLLWMPNADNEMEVFMKGVSINGETNWGGWRTVDQFFKEVGRLREVFTYNMQVHRLENQLQETKLEISLAKTRETQAFIRKQIQQLAVEAAALRLEGAQEALAYATERMFDEELWFKLAGELQDLARQTLDMAIHAAFLMERAYEAEFDRDLKRIRLDYGIGGAEGLLGGDYLKRDIAEFTHDYLQHAVKKSPVRLVISLQEQFPAAFYNFSQAGILEFSTDLEIFDRRFPGTCQRKIKKIEILVEGLLSTEGIFGSLLHQGISVEWGLENGEWRKKRRVLPPERMILSSYQFRRDLAIFQPSQEMLDQMENLGPQGNWRLELPRSANNLEYEALTDVKFIVYFDADYDESLAKFVKRFYPQTDGRSLIFSARLHFPDEYFRLEAERETTFTLHPSGFSFNYTDLKLRGFGVRLRPRKGRSMAAQPVTVVRLSDDSRAGGVTDQEGKLQSNRESMAPFAIWLDQTPADRFSVRLDPGTNLEDLDDIELFIDYRFTYRQDAVLSGEEPG
jgi:hypothetical protein